MKDRREREFSGVTVRIRRDRCIGTGACRQVLPRVLILDDRQVIDFREDAPAAVDRGLLYEACDACPVEALVLLDEDGSQVVP